MYIWRVHILSKSESACIRVIYSGYRPGIMPYYMADLRLLTGLSEKTIRTALNKLATKSLITRLNSGYLAVRPVFSKIEEIRSLIRRNVANGNYSGENSKEGRDRVYSSL